MSDAMTKDLLYLVLAVVFLFGGTKKILRAQKLPREQEEDDLAYKGVLNRGRVQIAVGIAFIILIVIDMMNA